MGEELIYWTFYTLSLKCYRDVEKPIRNTEPFLNTLLEEENIRNSNF
jgi:hypothetical protein